MGRKIEKGGLSRLLQFMFDGAVKCQSHIWSANSWGSFYMMKIASFSPPAVGLQL
jgi:hypothetical protein